MVFEDIILVLTGTLTALVTGLFYGYLVSVNGGLHRLNDSEYVKAIQSINAVIQNPLFFVSFIGPVILLPFMSEVLEYWREHHKRSSYHLGYS